MMVEMKLNSVGAREFERITGEHINEMLAIVLDNRVYSAPVIKDRISGGSAIIEGTFTAEEAEELALVLRCGPIGASVEVVKTEWLKQPSRMR
jgi:preprotein translocase subunit SecD